MGNSEVEEARAKLAAAIAEHGEEPEKQTLFDSAASLFHRIVDLTKWHQESDRNAAHEAVEEYVAPLGRNATPAGVVESDTVADNDNKGNENSFPTNTDTNPTE